MNRHQMQTQFQTQEGWWRHAVHTSDQVQENLSDPDTPFNDFPLKTQVHNSWTFTINNSAFDAIVEYPKL